MPTIPDGRTRHPSVTLFLRWGSIGRVELGEHLMQGFEALRLELESTFNDRNLPFDQASLEIDPTLKYSEIVRPVDAFVALHITNLAFSRAATKAGN
jgi:hypothetical protein